MNQQSTAKAKRIAVVGAGVSGLAAAWALSKSGHQVHVFESGARPGGSIQTQAIAGWLVECGPNSLLSGDPLMQKCIEDLGLAGELVRANSQASKRFIVRKGRPQALPRSPVSLVSTPLLGMRSKLALLTEPFQGRRERDGDVSLAEFVRDHFGQEIVDYMLNPFVAGVYAGDPSLLSTQHAFPQLWEAEQAKGSLLRGMISLAKKKKASGAKRGGIVSFRRGLGQLIDAFIAQLPAECLNLGIAIASLKCEEGAWHLESRAGRSYEGFDQVVLALPAHALGTLLVQGQRFFSELSEVIHPPVSSLFLGFRREQVAHPLDGFGVLIPARENFAPLGVLFSSSLFEGRAPEGHVALTVMVGGMRRPELAHLSQTELLDVVMPDLATLLGVQGAPVFQQVSQWPKAIPQYNLGYERFKACVGRVLGAHRGLHLVGNSLEGISVPACLVSGLKLAAQIG